jgi:hypothetical protein
LSELDIPRLEAYMPTVDLFIHQPVSDNYKGIYQLSTRYLKSLLKPQSIVISIPSAYFTGYNPEMIYLKDKKGDKVDGPFLLHDRNILALYAQGKSVQETLATIQQEDFYQAEQVQRNFDETLSELQLRETSLDVKISDLIKQHYQNSRLFHTINHPGSLVISEVAKSILNRLDIPLDQATLSAFCAQEVLDLLYFPIYPSIARHLKLKFVSDQNYFFHRFFHPQDAIAQFFAFYEQHPDIVDYNLAQLAGFSETDIATEVNLENCYRLVLGREPDTEGKTFWMQRIYSQMISLEWLIREFLNSSEFRAQRQASGSAIADGDFEEMVNYYSTLVRHKSAV